MPDLTRFEQENNQMPNINDKTNKGSDRIKRNKNNSCQKAMNETTGVKRNDAEAKQKSKKKPPNIDERLSLFRYQQLQGSGDIFFKGSLFQRSKKYYCELRGRTIVVFKQSPGDYSDLEEEDLISVLPVHQYEFEVVRKDDTDPRIYLTHTRTQDNSLVFIKVSGSEDELSTWCKSLGSIISTPLPTLSSLNVESVIGRGGGGKVFMVQWAYDGKPYALKVINKAPALSSSKTFRHVASERLLMEQVRRHPFLLSMRFAFQSDKNLFIGTPFCAGGDLSTYLRYHGFQYMSTRRATESKASGGYAFRNGQRRRYGRLSEARTRRIAAEIVLGIEHLHRLGVVYRDLKPENIFIDAEGHMKIGDYGLAKHLMRAESGSGRLRTMSVCGTRNYLPPEMLNRKLYSFEADMWSLGVMLFRMLCGFFPFDGEKTKDVFQRIKRDSATIPSFLSVEARELISGLLLKDPKRRLTITGVKRQAFFRDVNWEDILYKRTGPAVENLDVGSSPAEALQNFEISKLQSVTIGECIGDACVEEDTTSETVAHRNDPKKLMIGFEAVGTTDEEQHSAQPLAVRIKSGGLLSKLSSIDLDQISLPLSPRKSAHGK